MANLILFLTTINFFKQLVTHTNLINRPTGYTNSFPSLSHLHRGMLPVLLCLASESHFRKTMKCRFKQWTATILTLLRSSWAAPTASKEQTHVHFLTDD